MTSLMAQPFSPMPCGRQRKEALPGGEEQSAGRKLEIQRRSGGMSI